GAQSRYFMEPLDKRILVQDECVVPGIRHGETITGAEAGQSHLHDGWLCVREVNDQRYNAGGPGRRIVGATLVWGGKGGFQTQLLICARVWDEPPFGRLVFPVLKFALCN